MGLGKADQISVQSNQQCTTALDAMVWELDSAEVKYLGRKVSRQAIVNGMILWLAGLPKAERRRVLGEALRRIEDQVLKRAGDLDEAERLNGLLMAYLASRKATGGVRLGGSNVPQVTSASDQAEAPSDEPPPLPKSRFNRSVADLGRVRKKGARRAEPPGGGAHGLEGDEKPVGEDDRTPVGK